MRYFLFPILLGLAIVASLNFYTDPNSRWWQTHFNFAGNWKSDQCWVTPLRMDERTPRIQQIGFLPKIDLLGLGSSRLYPLESAMLPKRAHFYNASVSGATVWDYVAMWQKFKQQGNLPKHMIIYLDTWDFNKNTWQKYRWIINLGLVLDFLNDPEGNYDGRHLAQAEALSEWLSGSFYEFADLFSPAVLKESLEQMNIHRKTGSIQSNYVAQIKDRPVHFPAWKNDGSYLMPIEADKPMSLDEITRMGKNTGLGSMYVYMKDWETDENAVRLMGYLLDDAKRHGVDVLLIQPPFQHTTYDIINNTVGYKDIPGRYEQILAGLVQSHSNATYCNVIDPRAVACEPVEFRDSSHTLGSCSQKVINYCLGKVPQWYKH